MIILLLIHDLIANEVFRQKEGVKQRLKEQHHLQSKAKQWLSFYSFTVSHLKQLRQKVALYENLSSGFPLRTAELAALECLEKFQYTYNVRNVVSTLALHF